MATLIEPVSRHQCLIYAGPPSRHLPALAVTLRAKLGRNYRCLYLNSPPMVAGIRSYLAAADVDVETELARGSLVLSAEQAHLVDGRFDVATMLETLGNALAQALDGGYAGLWATGDMTWEMGPQKDFAQLVDYEWHLEEFLRLHPEMSGICQYHADLLPREVLRHGLLAHRSIFVNETLSLVNPHYLRVVSAKEDFAHNAEVDAMLDQLCRMEGAAD
jgi:hypothetical protein